MIYYQKKCSIQKGWQRQSQKNGQKGRKTYNKQRANDKEKAVNQSVNTKGQERQSYAYNKTGMQKYEGSLMRQKYHKQVMN